MRTSFRVSKRYSLFDGIWLEQMILREVWNREQWKSGVRVPHVCRSLADVGLKLQPFSTASSAVRQGRGLQPLRDAPPVYSRTATDLLQLLLNPRVNDYNGGETSTDSDRTRISKLSH